MSLIFMANGKFQKIFSGVKSWTSKKSYLLIWFGIIITLVFGAFQIGQSEGSKTASVNITNFYNQNDNPQNCDSFFSDIDESKWEIDKHWERNKDNPRHFIAESNKKLGGPSMKYYENISDNFRLSLDFKPIAENEIDLIIYIGDFYKLVLGDGNKDSFYLEKNGKRIFETRTGLDETKLKNRIKSNELVNLEINQSISGNYIPGEPATRSIIISFRYVPDEIENAQPISDDGYVFQLDDKLPPDITSHKISMGLLYSKNTIITEFYCFKLEK